MTKFSDREIFAPGDKVVAVVDPGAGVLTVIRSGYQQTETKAPDGIESWYYTDQLSRANIPTAI